MGLDTPVYCQSPWTPLGEGLRLALSRRPPPGEARPLALFVSSGLAYYLLSLLCCCFEHY